MKSMKFPLGTFVKVTGYMKRMKSDRGWNIESVTYASWSCTPRVGMVIGMKWVREGRRCFEDEVGWVFEPTSTRLFYVVKFGAMNKPWLVMEEDMQPAEPVRLPMLELIHAVCNDKARAKQRQYAAEQRRDGKGRFVR